MNFNFVEGRKKVEINFLSTSKLHIKISVQFNQKKEQKTKTRKKCKERKNKANKSFGSQNEINTFAAKQKLQYGIALDVDYIVIAYQMFIVFPFFCLIEKSCLTRTKKKCWVCGRKKTSRLFSTTTTTTTTTMTTCSLLHVFKRSQIFFSFSRKIFRAARLRKIFVTT